MKGLSLLTTVVTILISSCVQTYASTHSTGGTVSFSGYVYEPQCKVNLDSKSQVNIECFRNGKNTSKTGSLKDGKKVESDYVKVEYDKFSKLPMLNVYYE